MRYILIGLNSFVLTSSVIFLAVSEARLDASSNLIFLKVPYLYLRSQREKANS